MSFLKRFPRFTSSINITRPASTSTFNSRTSVPSTTTPTTPIEPTTKVSLTEVKRTLIKLLETRGPISRRKLYDEHISKLFPASPFTPNEAPKPYWLRNDPNPPKVYMTMSKFKKEVLGDLSRSKSIGIVTVTKIKRALEVINLEDGPLRKQIEQAISNEPDNGHVCVAGNWWNQFMVKQTNFGVNQEMIRGQKPKEPKNLKKFRKSQKQSWGRR